VGLVVRRGDVFRATGGAARPEGGAVARARSFRPRSAQRSPIVPCGREASRLSTVGRKALAERAVVGLTDFALSMVDVERAIPRSIHPARKPYQLAN